MHSSYDLWSHVRVQTSLMCAEPLDGESMRNTAFRRPKVLGCRVRGLLNSVVRFLASIRNRGHAPDLNHR